MLSLFLCFKVLLFWLRGQATVNEPELLWAYGGCTSWCETGWYSSPVFFENPSNSSRTVIAASMSSIYGIDAHTGDTLWTHDEDRRTWPGLVFVDDWDNDGGAIIAAKRLSKIVILDTLGQLKRSVELGSDEFRSLAVGHFVGDSDYRIVVGQSGDGVNTLVYDSSLSLKSGWPQTNNEEDGHSWGIYNDNIGLVDSDGDGFDDMIVAPSDNYYVCAFDKDGQHLTTNARYENKNWGRVGFWTNEFYDKQGWAYCSESTRPNFARSAVSNVPHPTEEGSVLLAVAGNVRNCSTSPYTDLWFGPFVFGLDRGRPNVSVADGVSVNWANIPQYTGAPFSEDYSVIEMMNPNIAVGDLDGDGVAEMVYSSNDGRVHVFSLNDNSEEPWNWPYSVYDSSQGYYTYSSEPVIVDFDNDGFAEVVVATWPQKGFDASGDLIILAYDGTLPMRTNHSATANDKMTTLLSMRAQTTEPMTKCENHKANDFQ